MGVDLRAGGLVRCQANLTSVDVVPAKCYDYPRVYQWVVTAVQCVCHMCVGEQT